MNTTTTKNASFFPSIYLFQLPDSIFIVLQSFMSLDDFHYLMNASKKEFAAIKRQYLQLSLTPQSTLEYVRDHTFRRRVQEIIQNPQKQLSLRFPYCSPVSFPKDLACHKFYCGLGNNYDLEMFSKVECIYGLSYLTDIITFPYLPYLKKAYLSYFNQLTDCRQLKHLYSLQLTHCPNLIDITPLQHIPELMLNNCPLITNFSMLGKQIRLTLAKCDHLIDVSNLQQVKYLTIENCEKVIDLSPLYNIYELNLFYCSQISNISMLGNHHKLQIIECDYQLIGYDTALQHVPHVWLNHCNITDVQVLRYAKSVSLIKCNELVDITPLANVEKVSLLKCEKIQDITSLRSIRKLSIGPLPALQSYEGLCSSTLDSISLSDLNMITNYDFLQHIPHCYIYNSSSFSHYLNQFRSSSIHHQPELFNHLQLLHIQHCPELKQLPVVLGKIPTLYLINCDQLEDISSLGQGNRYVKLVLCNKIRDIRSLSSIYRVTIVKCTGIRDYSVVQKVPRLKIITLSSKV